MGSRLLVVFSCLTVLLGVLGRGDIADGERYGKLPPPEYYIRRENPGTTEDLGTTSAPTAATSTTSAEQLTLPAATETRRSTGPTATASTPGVTGSNPELPTEIMQEEVSKSEYNPEGAKLSVREKERLSVDSVKVSAMSSSGTHAETSKPPNDAAVDVTDVKAPEDAFLWESNPEPEVTDEGRFDGFADFPAMDDPEPLRPNKTEGGLDVASEDLSKWPVVRELEKEGRKPQYDKTPPHGERTVGDKAEEKHGRESNPGPGRHRKPEQQNSSVEAVSEGEKPLTNMFNTYNTFNLKLPAEEEGQEFLQGFNDHFAHFRLALEGIAANHTDNLAKLQERIETLESHSWGLEVELGDVRAENMQLKQQLEEITAECRDRNAKLEEKTCQTGNDTLRLKAELEEVKHLWVENVTRMEEECFRVTHSVNYVMQDMEVRIRDETNKNMSEVQDNIAWGCLAVQGECRSRMDNLTEEVKKVTSVQNNRVEALTQADASTIYFPAFTPANARDCAELYRKGVWQSGVYRIQPDIADGGPVIEAFCDMDTDSGGWTVIQRRPDWMGPLRFFNKNWTDYSSGFGDVRGEHWLGNEAAHHLTTGRENVLRIDMRSASTRWHASYSRFNVGEGDKDYRLTLSDYHGNAGDALTQDGGKIDNAPFSTADRDNDACAECNCAADLHGGWWYRHCEVGLNGEHGGVNYGWNSREISLYPEFVEMKTRPTDFDKLVAMSGLMAKENHFVEETFETPKEETIKESLETSKDEVKFVE